MRAKVSGTHTFYTVSDDGVRLWVNGQLIIDNFTDHAPTENTGTISLTAGQGYDIRMDLYENGGGAVGRLSWSAPGLAREVIPTSHLHPYALLVVGSTTLNTGDAAVRARLEQLGHSMVVRTGVAATSADAAGKAVVVVSSTVNSGDVNRKFRNVVNAVVCWEPLLFDDLGMTGTTSGTSFGTVSGQTQVTIVNATHPLAAGLSGSFAVTTSAQTFSFGVPNASAVVAARPSTTSSRGFVFGYERSAAMPGLAAPGRRVGLFLQNTTAAALNDSGRSLLDAAIRWAQGR